MNTLYSTNGKFNWFEKNSSRTFSTIETHFIFVRQNIDDQNGDSIVRDVQFVLNSRNILLYFVSVLVNTETKTYLQIDSF